MIVDSHCHLDYPGLAEQEGAVIRRAGAAGVRLMITIGTTRAGWAKVLDVAGRHDSVVCAIGIHPHHAGAEGLDDPEALVAAASDPKVVGIGETGLDYHYDYSPRARQEASFRTHIEACRRTGLPLIVHTREADDDTMSILEQEMAAGPFTGVIHCFSSSRRLAERAVGLGLHLGIGGILTFKRSDELRAIVRDMPVDRLILETDAPYLAPLPHRGRTNEPAFTTFVAKVLAEVKGVSIGEIERMTTANVLRLFPEAVAYVKAA